MAVSFYSIVMMVSRRITFAFIATHLLLERLMIDAQNLDHISLTAAISFPGSSSPGTGQETNSVGLFKKGRQADIPLILPSDVFAPSSPPSGSSSPSNPPSGSSSPSNPPSRSSSPSNPPSGSSSPSNPPSGSSPPSNPPSGSSSPSNPPSGTPRTLPPSETPRTLPPFCDAQPVLSPSTGGNAPPIGAIAGGEFAGKGVYTHQVYLQTLKDENGKSTGCGGSLIANDLIVTAAHCLDDFFIDYAVLGAYDFTEIDKSGKPGVYNTDTNPYERISVCEQLRHPDWVRYEENDIALLRLCKESELAKQGIVRPIKLNAFAYVPSDGQTVTVTGWGSISDADIEGSDILRKTNLQVMSNKDCNDTYANIVNSDEVITPDEMCAYDPCGKKDTCKGDSGGPAMIGHNVYDLVLVGVTSHFGRLKNPPSDPPCPSKTPGIYTRISYNLDWILSFGCCLSKVKPCGIQTNNACGAPAVSPVASKPTMPPKMAKIKKKGEPVSKTNDKKTPGTTNNKKGKGKDAPATVNTNAQLTLLSFQKPSSPTPVIPYRKTSRARLF